MNQADYDAISYEQLLDELALIDLGQVLEMALEDIDNGTDLALKACDRLAARLAARNLQRSAQDLLSWPHRFSHSMHARKEPV